MQTPNEDSPIDDAIGRARRGDTGAFEVVVRRFERPLRAWLAACGSPGVDVDEVAQWSLLAAFSRLDEYRAGTEFGAWLFAIARFQLKTEVTRLRRVADYHARYGLDLLQRELDRRSTEPPELDQAREGNFVQQTLNRLPAEDDHFVRALMRQLSPGRTTTARPRVGKWHMAAAAAVILLAGVHFLSSRTEPEIAKIMIASPKGKPDW